MVVMICREKMLEQTTPLPDYLGVSWVCVCLSASVEHAYVFTIRS